MSDQHKNFSYSTVATAPSPATSGTSLVVATGDGAKFPTVPFNATVWPVSAQPTTANAEIVRVTAISTDTLTITRAQESSSARTVVVGDQIAATVTAKTLTDVELNLYVTDQDKTIPATTEVIFDDYLELAASFFYELSANAILVIGDFATPLSPPDQNANIFVTVNDETVPQNSEIVFGDFYELSPPFVVELASSALLQVGTNSTSGSIAQTTRVVLTSGDLSTTSTSFVNATGIVVTIATSASKCLVVFSGAGELAAAAYVCVDLAIDGVQQGQTFGLTFARASGGAGGGNVGFTYLTPVLTAGVHTFQLLWRVSASTGTFYASATVPAILSVCEISA